MNSSKNKKEEKKKSFGGAVAAFVLVLISAMSDIGSSGASFIGFLVILGVLAAIIFLIVKLVSKAAVKDKKASFQSRGAELIRQWSRDSSEMPITSTHCKPGTCVYNDRLSEESQRHDVELRLRMLDDFLKNGIIEKEEYRKLKEKYSRNLR